MKIHHLISKFLSTSLIITFLFQQIAYAECFPVVPYLAQAAYQVNIITKNELEHSQNTSFTDTLKYLSEEAYNTISNDLKIDDTGYFKLTTNKNGDSVLTADVSVGNLKNVSARDLAARAGLKDTDDIRYEFNLKTGERFVFLSVKEIGAFFDQKGQDQRTDILKLKNVLTGSIGSIDSLRSLDLVGKLRDNNNTDIIGAFVEVDSKTNFKDITLKQGVSNYVNSNFNFLHQGQYNLVLAIDLESSKVNIEALSIHLDSNNIKDILSSLDRRDPRQQKLAFSLEGLGKSIGGDPGNLESLRLSVDIKGDYKINVRIRSEVLRGLPNLMSKLFPVIVRSGEAATNQSFPAAKLK